MSPEQLLTIYSEVDFLFDITLIKSPCLIQLLDLFSIFLKIMQQRFSDHLVCAGYYALVLRWMHS